ncbi:phosphoribosylglycinamide formyltransferase [Tenuibacillus multivorans]|uniref:Phosphoribosylglycinamide formyltransferase n=1 Tax=Tenuibacillus multivorans TaxID=237069 RepID=A0A1H0F8W9_9BACI|nr:phosphoribosylglycinamide formyltransferase [Tenuibacillus multivorans]GEL78026.1 phosphoribosylglycinamide formyltransferase [Tenuibacillus multivorans]SDN91083.1 phosphoribosylglycinamide formyltransferase-1 [Tenuibacillus multivorans]
MKRIAVMASGSGSNFESIVNTSKAKNSSYEVALLFSDQPAAYALERAKQLGVESVTFLPKNYPDKMAYEADLLALLIRYRIDFIALAGYMRLIGPTLLHRFDGDIVNIHPSLLPQFPGLDAIQQAIDAGVDETGVTIHYIDAGIDTGPIIEQEAVAINPEDSYETVKKKVQRVEHRLYPQTLAKLLRGDETIAKTSVN